MVDQLRTLLTARPFEPFRVTLSGGERFEVRHPEFGWLTEGGLYVGIPGDDAEVPERAAYCSLLHVASIESIGGSVAGR